jgi:hypothetical protein
MIPIRNVLATSPVHFYCTALAKGSYGSITMAGTTYQSGQTANYNEVDYWITGNPPAPTSDWFFDYWSVMYIGGRSWVDNQYAQSTWFHLRGEAYLWAYFYSPIHTNNPTSPITWGTKQRITGAGNQWSGKQLSVVYCTQGSGMGPPNRDGVPPFGSGNNGYLWATVTVNSGVWDTGYIYPTLPISQNQQLPQTYDVYALWGSDPSEEVDSNVVSFTLNQATAQMAAPALSPGSIQLGQSVTITDEIFSPAYVNGNDLSGTLTVQARKLGGSWTDVASQTFESHYGYSSVYGQHGDFYDLSTSWTPPETGSYDVRIAYNGNHYFLPLTSSSSSLAVGQPTYSVTVYAHCNTDGNDIVVRVRNDSDPSGYDTPYTFTGLSGTHTFTVPSVDSSGHPFKQWNTGEPSPTIIASSTATFTAYYEQAPYQFTINAYCNTESKDVTVGVTVDDSPPPYNTPYTFLSTVATHKFTVPSSDSSGHSFRQWSTGETATSINVNSGGTYTAYYGAVQRRLTVTSAHDSPNPTNGDKFYDDGQLATCSVTSPVTEGGVIYVCTGWTGTGSVVPSSGIGTSVGPFPMTADSTITWNWRVDNAPLTPQFSSSSTLLLRGAQGTYEAFSTDPDVMDSVTITFDWGDGTQSTQGPVSSGTPLICNHAWSHTNMYEVKAMANDTYGAQSSWCAPIEVTVISYSEENLWAGYILGMEEQPSITSVEAEWIMPSFTAYTFSFSAIWTGIGGYGKDRPLLQAGIAQMNLVGGGGWCRPFWQAVPQSDILPIHIDLNPAHWVSTGDHIKVSISEKSPGIWTIVVQDGTLWTWTESTTYNPSKTTAEWIYELGAKGSGICSFTSIAFTKARVTAGGITYQMANVGASLNSNLYLLNFQRGGVTCTRTSGITAYEGFTILDTGLRPSSISPITSISLHSDANLTIFDSSGNHVGFNDSSGLIDMQISDALYYEDIDGVQQAFLFRPDQYQIDLIGTGDGTFHLHTQLVSNDTTTLDKWINGTITVDETKTYVLLHQISIQSVISKAVIGEGYASFIVVTVANNGNYTENFNVTAYTNATVIGRQLVTLISANSTTLTFTWNTTGFAKGNYTISAYAEPILGETDFDDNNFTDGWVAVTWLGDSNGDFVVDEDDLWHFCGAFIDYYKIPKWLDANCDFNNDGKIDEDDLWKMCEGFIDYWKAH